MLSLFTHCAAEELQDLNNRKIHSVASTKEKKKKEGTSQKKDYENY